jgi:hypothetical protein
MTKEEIGYFTAEEVTIDAQVGETIIFNPMPSEGKIEEYAITVNTANLDSSEKIEAQRTVVMKKIKTLRLQIKTPGEKQIECIVQKDSEVLKIWKITIKAIPKADTTTPPEEPEDNEAELEFDVVVTRER